MTRYQFGISALFSQTSFGGEPVVVSPNVGCFLRLVDGSTTRADQFPGARTYNIEVVIDFRKVVVEQFSFERRNGWLLSNSNWWMINLVPRGLSYPPYGARENERPWKTLVTWLQNKIISEGGVLCLTFFCLVYSRRSRSDLNSKIDLLILLQL